MVILLRRIIFFIMLLNLVVIQVDCFEGNLEREESNDLLDKYNKDFNTAVSEKVSSIKNKFSLGHWIDTAIEQILGDINKIYSELPQHIKELVIEHTFDTKYWIYFFGWSFIISVIFLVSLPVFKFWVLLFKITKRIIIIIYYILLYVYSFVIKMYYKLLSFFISRAWLVSKEQRYQNKIVNVYNSIQNNIVNIKNLSITNYIFHNYSEKSIVIRITKKEGSVIEFIGESSQLSSFLKKNDFITINKEDNAKQKQK